MSSDPPFHHGLLEVLLLAQSSISKDLHHRIILDSFELLFMVLVVPGYIEEQHGGCVFQGALLHWCDSEDQDIKVI